MTWAVNVAAPFLLTACLLGTVQRRIVNVASISAASSIDFDNLQQVGWRDGPHCGAGQRPGHTSTEGCMALASGRHAGVDVGSNMLGSPPCGGVGSRRSVGQARR